MLHDVPAPPRFAVAAHFAIGLSTHSRTMPCSEPLRGRTGWRTRDRQQDGSAIIPTVRTHLWPSSVAAASRNNTSDDGSTCALSRPPSEYVHHSAPTQLIVQVLSGQTVPTMLLTHAPCDVHNAAHPREPPANTLRGERTSRHACEASHCVGCQPWGNFCKHRHAVRARTVSGTASHPLPGGED